MFARIISPLVAILAQASSRSRGRFGGAAARHGQGIVLDRGRFGGAAARHGGRSDSVPDLHLEVLAVLECQENDDEAASRCGAQSIHWASQFPQC